MTIQDTIKKETHTQKNEKKKVKTMKQTISKRFVFFRDLAIMKMFRNYHLEIKTSTRFNLSLK